MIINVVFQQFILFRAIKEVVFSQFKNVRIRTFFESILSPERPLAGFSRGGVFGNKSIEFQRNQCCLGSPSGFSCYIYALKMFLCEHFGFLILIP